MNKATTVYESFTSAATTSNQSNTVFTGRAGQGFAVEWVGFQIESGAGTDVSVQLFVGENALVPQDDPFDIPGEFVRLPAEQHLGPDTPIEARHSNTSSNPIAIRVVVAGTEQPRTVD